MHRWIGWFALVLAVLSIVACASGPVVATPRPSAGTEAAPREVNLIAKDYSFLPDALDLVPGETVLLHVVNGGLDTHEAVIGDGATQAAWASAEAGTEGAPPGPTPVVSVAPDVAGLRIVVRSGERVDIRWTVPADPSRARHQDPAAWVVACHIPGHLEKGMIIPIRWVETTAS